MVVPHASSAEGPTDGARWTNGLAGKLPIEVGQMLKAVRRGLGFGVSDVADAIGVSASHVSRCERGHVRPRIDVAERWAKVLGLTADERARFFSACAPLSPWPKKRGLPDLDAVPHPHQVISVVSERRRAEREAEAAVTARLLAQLLGRDPDAEDVASAVEQAIRESGRGLLAMRNRAWRAGEDDDED